MSFYDKAAATTARVLLRFGASATLTRNAAGVYDPATGTATPTVTTQTVQAAVFDYDQEYVNGTSILAGDKQVFMSAVGLTFKPQTGDVLLWQAVNYNVLKSKPLAPAGIDVLFELQVRS
jgi:hypothetical protein